MDTKFTPGPWSIGPVDDCQITHLGPDGGRYEIADISGDYNQPELWPIMEANARLISAAPDMYEALKEARALNAYKGEELEALFRNWFDIFAAPALAKVQQ